MARGTPPRSPAGGGRGQQPPRRGGTPPKGGQRGQKPPPGQKQGQQPAQKQVRKPGQTPAQKAAQTRHLLEHQRQNAAKAAGKKQHQARQQLYLREAHTQRRQAEAEQRNEALRQQVAQLESILADGLSRSARIDLAALFQTPQLPAFDPGALGEAAPEPVWEDFTPAGGVLGGVWGGKLGRQRREAAARAEFERARDQWRVAEQERMERLAAAERAHEAGHAGRREQIEEYNSRIARVAAGLRTREPAAVESFLRTVLRRVPLPASFPRRFEVTFHRDRELAVLRLVLPGPEVVPAVSEYEYLPPVDEMRFVPRPPEQARALYWSVLAQVSLLVLRDVFEAEPQLASISLHGLVDRHHPGTGEPAFACLVRLAADRSAFEELDLEEPVAENLRALSAQVSADPYAREPLAEAAEAGPAEAAETG